MPHPPPPAAAVRQADSTKRQPSDRGEMPCSWDLPADSPLADGLDSPAPPPFPAESPASRRARLDLATPREQQDKPTPRRRMQIPGLTADPDPEPAKRPEPAARQARFAPTLVSAERRAGPEEVSQPGPTASLISATAANRRTQLAGQTPRPESALAPAPAGAEPVTALDRQLSSLLESRIADHLSPVGPRLPRSALRAAPAEEQEVTNLPPSRQGGFSFPLTVLLSHTSRSSLID